MSYPISVLKNGIRVVTAPLKDRRSVAVGIWTSVGGRDESEASSGVSHFLEHLVFKGTARRTANQIKESIEGVGGSMNAFTSEEHTCFLAKAGRKHFENVFDVLADMVHSASLKDTDIEKERTVILEEIKMTQDQPSQLVEEILSEIVWPHHAIGRPLAGTLQTVNGLTPDFIRSYRNTFYKPQFITIAVSGDVDHKAVVQLGENTFKEDRTNLEKKIDLFHSTQTKPQLKMFHKDTEQIQLALAVHAFPKNHPDEYVLDVLNVILGGNMSSRLFNEVREERGLAYDIGSFSRKYHETGAFVVAAGVDTKKSSQALEVILAELVKTTQEPVKPDELRRAKDFYLGQLDMALESTMSNMLWVGDSVVSTGKCRTPDDVTQAVEKVTAQDILRVAKAIMQNRSLSFAAVGPNLPEKDFERILSFSG